MSYTAEFEKLPKFLKCAIFLLFLVQTPILYRAARYVETKNTVTLVTGIVCLVIPFLGAVLGIVDFICEITGDKCRVLVD